MAIDMINSTTCAVSTSVEIEHTYHVVNNVFDLNSPDLAELYKPYKRCSSIVDHCVYNLYGNQIKTYFEAHDIAATIHSADITQDRKTVETLIK